MFNINLSNILYRVLGGLFLLSVVMGVAGVGVSQDRSHPKPSYLSFLKKTKFFKDRERATYNSRETQRNIQLSREKQTDLMRSMDDKRKDQRFMLAAQQDRQQPRAQPAALFPADRSREVRERLNDMRYKNLDAQERYRRLMDSQRFR